MMFSPGKKQPSLAQRRLHAPAAFSARGIDESKTSVVKPAELVTPESHVRRIEKNVKEANLRHLQNHQRAKAKENERSHIKRTKSASYEITSKKAVPKPQTKNPYVKSRREAKSDELAAKLAYLKKLEEKEKEDAAMLLLAKAMLATQKDLLKEEKRSALEMFTKLEPLLSREVVADDSPSKVPQRNSSADEREQVTQNSPPPVASASEIVSSGRGLKEPLIQQRRPFVEYDSEDEYFDDDTFWGRGRSAMDVKQREPFVGGDPLSSPSTMASPYTSDCDDDNCSEDNSGGDGSGGDGSVGGKIVAVSAPVSLSAGEAEMSARLSPMKTDSGRVADIAYDILPPEELSRGDPTHSTYVGESSTISHAGVSASAGATPQQVTKTEDSFSTSNPSQSTAIESSAPSSTQTLSKLPPTSTPSAPSPVSSIPAPSKTSLSKLWGLGGGGGQESPSSEEVDEEEWDD